MGRLEACLEFRPATLLGPSRLEPVRRRDRGRRHETCARKVSRIRLRFPGPGVRA